MVRSPLQSPILKSLLNNVYNWWIKNEMTFGISKCFTLVEEMQYMKFINKEGILFIKFTI